MKFAPVMKSKDQLPVGHFRILQAVNSIARHRADVLYVLHEAPGWEAPFSDFRINDSTPMFEESALKAFIKLCHGLCVETSGVRASDWRNICLMGVV